MAETDDNHIKELIGITPIPKITISKPEIKKIVNDVQAVMADQAGTGTGTDADAGAGAGTGTGTDAGAGANQAVDSGHAKDDATKDIAPPVLATTQQPSLDDPGNIGGRRRTKHKKSKSSKKVAKRRKSRKSKSGSKKSRRSSSKKSRRHGRK